MIDTAVYDFLHHPDHLGHPGMIRSMLSMETVSRLALHRPDASADASVDRVSSAASNLAAKLDQILEASAWTVAAEGEVATLADEVLSRMDVDGIHLDYDRGQRAATQQLAELESNTMDDVDPIVLIELRHVLAMSYVDYEGRLFDAVDARYRRAGSSAVGWAHYVVHEVRRLAGGAAVLLGTTEHSNTPLARCPGAVNPLASPPLTPTSRCAQAAAGTGDYPTELPHGCSPNGETMAGSLALDWSLTAVYFE